MHLQTRWIMRGIIAGLIVVSYGAWLAWEGLTNRTGDDPFGRSCFSRRLKVTAGLVCMAAGIGLICFLLAPIL